MTQGQKCACMNTMHSHIQALPLVLQELLESCLDYPEQAQ